MFDGIREELTFPFIFGHFENQILYLLERSELSKPQVENEKFAMRTYLNRIGFIGSEFANCREHLTAALTGSAAWRYGVA